MLPLLLPASLHLPLLHRHRSPPCCSARSALHPWWFSTTRTVGGAEVFKFLSLKHVLGESLSWGLYVPPTSSPGVNMGTGAGTAYLQVTLEQHRFELHRCAHVQGFCLFVCFYSKYTVGPPYSSVSHPQIQPPQMENSIFNLPLGICGCGGLNTCIVLCQGCQTSFTRGHISLAVAFKGPSVTLGLYKRNYSLTRGKGLGTASG